MHGKGAEKYDNVRIGVNSRLDTIQAAILIEKLKIFPDELQARDKVAAVYAADLCNKFKIPQVADGITSAWAQYTIIVGIVMLCKKLKELGVPTVIYYPKALTQQDGYSFFPVVSNGVPKSEALTGKVLSLPMHPYLSIDQQRTIISKLL